MARIAFLEKVLEAGKAMVIAPYHEYNEFDHLNSKVEWRIAYLSKINRELAELRNATYALANRRISLV